MVGIRVRENSLTEPVREGGGIAMMVAKGDLEQAKELLRNTDMSCREIAEKTGCVYQTILNWSKKTRGKKSGGVTTRPMTPEEREKYLPSPPDQIEDLGAESELTQIEESVRQKDILQPNGELSFSISGKSLTLDRLLRIFNQALDLSLIHI